MSTEPVTPTPPVTPAAPPTASISASPSTVPAAGATVTLTWSTTGASAANISNIGPVALSGTQTVTPTTSTNYTLQAIAEDGTAVLATATVTVGNTPAPPVPEPTTTPGAAAQQVQLDILDDVAAVKGTLSSVAAQARAEYETLTPALQARVHQVFNDIEQAAQASLAGMHTLFGAAAPSVKK